MIASMSTTTTASAIRLFSHKIEIRHEKTIQ